MIRRGVAGLLLWPFLFLLTRHSTGAEAELKIGPPGIGSGGTNPTGIPPTALDLDFAYLTDDQWQYSFSVGPGFLVGKRYTKGNLFAGVGMGLIISVNGAGVGPYTSLGWTKALTTSFTMVVEAKQAIGFPFFGSSDHIVMPYALRVGVNYAY